jgi:UDP-N-acetylglucosamine 4,6-dehydratase/5-epimerase
MIDRAIAKDSLAGRSVLVTGGTGSFGKHCVDALLKHTAVSRIVVFSRDELKQHEMQNHHGESDRLRFFIGNVRDRDRLLRAFDGVDVVIHAAALKQIPAAEYNPFEFVKTNVLGAQNVIDAAIDRGVEKVVALSTDKASSPINLYGATKLVSDRLFVAGNAYVGRKRTRFSVVRYGNVIGSRGSVVWRLKQLQRGADFSLTDPRMTRFWITLDQAVRFVLASLDVMHGGEIFVPKLPSMRLTHLIEVLGPELNVRTTGIRPGEKLHEEMISVDEARSTIDRGDHFAILPQIDWTNQEKLAGEPVAPGFRYASDNNADWLDADRLRQLLRD